MAPNKPGGKPDGHTRMGTTKMAGRDLNDATQALDEADSLEAAWASLMNDGETPNTPVHNPRAPKDFGFVGEENNTPAIQSGADLISHAAQEGTTRLETGDLEMRNANETLLAKLNKLRGPGQIFEDVSDEGIELISKFARTTDIFEGDVVIGTEKTFQDAALRETGMAIILSDQFNIETPRGNLPIKQGRTLGERGFRGEERANEVKAKTPGTLMLIDSNLKGLRSMGLSIEDSNAIRLNILRNSYLESANNNLSFVDPRFKPVLARALQPLTRILQDEILTTNEQRRRQLVDPKRLPHSKLVPREDKYEALIVLDGNYQGPIVQVRNNESGEIISEILAPTVLFILRAAGMPVDQLSAQLFVEQKFFATPVEVRGSDRPADEQEKVIEILETIENTLLSITNKTYDGWLKERELRRAERAVGQQPRRKKKPAKKKPEAPESKGLVQSFVDDQRAQAQELVESANKGTMSSWLRTQWERSTIKAAIKAIDDSDKPRRR